MTCSHCGAWIRDPARDNCATGEVPYPYDDGFGRCPRCEAWIGRRNDREMDQLIALLAGGLNPANRATLSTMPREEQEVLVLAALEEGHITYGPARALRPGGNEEGGEGR